MRSNWKICGLLLYLSASVCAGEIRVSEVVFVAFDTETTGFSPKDDRLVEIGAVKFRGSGDVLASTNWLVNPQCSIPWYVTDVHHITDDMVADAPAFEAIWPAFESFCSGAVLLAHNARFDLGFLKAELKRAEICAPAVPTADALPLFRAWFPHSLSHKLDALSVYLNLEGKVSHRADADAVHLVNIFNVGMKQRSRMTMRQLESTVNGFMWLDGEQRDADDYLQR